MGPFGLRIVTAAGACLVLAAGCTEDRPPRTVPGQLTPWERDSVVAQCRKLLAERPDDAGLHLLLGNTLLEKPLESIRRTGRTWPWGMLLFDASLNDAGRPVSTLPERLSSAEVREIASHLSTALKVNPHSAPTLRAQAFLNLALASTWYADTLYDTAAEFYSRSIAIDSMSTEAYIGLASCLVRRHRDSAALAVLQTSLGHDSTSGSTFLAMGHVYADSGIVPIAFTCWENAARLGLTHPGEYLDLARVYLDRLFEVKLLGRLLYLREEAPGIVRTLVRNFLKLVGAYHPGIALRMTSMALEVDSSNAEAHLLRARIEHEEGDTASAIEDIAAALASGNAAYFSYAGFAPGVLQKAALLVPHRPQISLLIGSEIQRLSGAPAAIPVFRTAADQLPQNPAPAFLLGRAFLANGDTAEAFAWFDSTLACPAGVFGNMYWDLVHIFAAAGDSDRILLAVEKEMEISEDAWIPRLFEQELRSRQYDANRVFLAAADCTAGYYCSWASGAEKTNRMKLLAAGFFRRAHRLVPASAVPYLGLGDLNLDYGDRTEARRDYRIAETLGSRDATLKLKLLARDGPG